MNFRVQFLIKVLPLTKIINRADKKLKNSFKIKLIKNCLEKSCTPSPIYLTEKFNSRKIWIIFNEKLRYIFDQWSNLVYVYWFGCPTWNLNLELNLSSRSQNWYISTEDRKEKLWLKSIGCRMMSSSIYALIEIAALRVRYSRATQNCYNNTYSHCLLAF